jgi:NADH-quinone oxidoreductase subunit N
MNKADFNYLIPFIIIAGTPILIMLIISLTKIFRFIYILSIVALISALIASFFIDPAVSHKVSSLLILDHFSILFMMIIIIGSILVTLLSYNYIQYQESEKAEFLILLFVAVLGSMLLVASTHFISFFLGLETLSIALFILIAYRKIRHYAIEAGVKYFVLASVSSAFLLFGMGLIYIETGEMEFEKIANVLQASVSASPLLLAGFGMMLAGLGFKLALVPFHMWTPDVYQGAPAPVTAFVATISKGAVMALLLRLFYEINGFGNKNIVLVITVISVLSMFVGNLLAIRQQNIKRILAYSSIANLGYLLVTLLAGTEKGIQAAVFYLISYIITTLGAFGVIGLLSDKEFEAEKLADYKGLFWKHPWVGLVFTLALLSLAGIPITAGFMAKFYVVFAGLKANLWLLIICLIINSVIGLYYYLRIITTLFAQSSQKKFPTIALPGHVVLFVMFICILMLGIFPELLFELFSGLTGF